MYPRPMQPIQDPAAQMLAQPVARPIQQPMAAPMPFHGAGPTDMPIMPYRGAAPAGVHMGAQVQPPMNMARGRGPIQR